MATAPPCSVEQAGCAALREFLRTRICHARSTVVGASARVLLEDGAPLDFYVQSVDVLAPNGSRIVVNANDKTYGRLHERLAPGHASLVSQDVPGAADRFDLILLPLIRRSRDRPAPASIIESALRRMSPRGSLLLFQPDESAGAFRLRDLARRSASSAAAAAASATSPASWSGLGLSIVRLSAGWLLPGADGAPQSAADAAAFKSLFLNPADVSSYRGFISPLDVHAALAAVSGAPAGEAATGYSVHTERVDAILDVADLLQHGDTPLAAAMLSDIIDGDMEAFAAHEPVAYRGVMTALRALSLCNVSQRSRAGGVGPFHVPVHLPYTAILISQQPSESAAAAAVVPASAVTGGLGQQQWWDAHGRWRAAAAAMRHPMAMPSLTLMYSVPALVQRHVDGALSLRPLPLRLAQTASASAQVSTARSEPASRRAATAVTAPDAVEELPNARAAVVFDPCFPHGGAGPFFNRGLAYWHEQRAAWTARPPGYTHPPYPPAYDLDEIIEELTDLTNRVELPGPVRLPDMIDMFQDVWSPVDDSDESWSEE